MSNISIDTPSKDPLIENDACQCCASKHGGRLFFCYRELNESNFEKIFRRVCDLFNSQIFLEEKPECLLKTVNALEKKDSGVSAKLKETKHFACWRKLVEGLPGREIGLMHNNYLDRKLKGALEDADALHLDLSKKSKLPAREIFAILAQYERKRVKLQSLNLSYCENVDDDLLANLAGSLLAYDPCDARWKNNIFSHLKNANFSGTAISPDGLLAFIEHAPCLQIIEAKDCSRFRALEIDFSAKGIELYL